jgi:hypothetical protein
MSHLSSVGSSFSHPAVLRADLVAGINIVDDIREVNKCGGHNDIDIAGELGGI